MVEVRSTGPLALAELFLQRQLLPEEFPPLEPVGLPASCQDQAARSVLRPEDRKVATLMRERVQQVDQTSERQDLMVQKPAVARRCPCE